jgi:uncharacterized membrane protein|tara:strand:+ start:1306 stop:2112 length:807 start_codon:yes stop_codon:yes gene_type:complete
MKNIFNKFADNKPISNEDKKERAKSFKLSKYGLYAFLGIGLITILVSSFMIMIKVNQIENPDQAMLTFVYILSIGWMAAIIMVIPLIVARKEIWNKFRVFGRKSKVIILRMIGGDANEIEAVVKLEGNTVELGENKVIINPRKSTMRDGVRVITYVSSNALAHNYFQDPNKTLKQLGEEISKKDTEDFHDVYSDPIRIDAKYFNETFLAAQQTNPDILKKIIGFLTSKNVIGVLVIIALTAGAAALLSLQANNMLNTIPFCNPTQITP